MADAKANPGTYSHRKAASHVEEVNIGGLARTNDDFLIKKVKELFQAKTFDEIVKLTGSVRDDFAALDIFSKVTPVIGVATYAPSKPARSGSCPYNVTYDVTEKRFLDPLIHARFRHCNHIYPTLTLSVNNIFGRAETIKAEYQHGLTNVSHKEISFEKPMPNNPRVFWSIGAWSGGNQRLTSHFTALEQALFGQLRFRTPFGQHRVRVDCGDREIQTGAHTPASIVEEAGHRRNWTVSHQFIRDSRDSRMLPSSGGLLQVDKAWSNPGLVTGGLRLERAMRLPWGGLVLHGCVQAGGVADMRLNDVPDTEKQVSIADRFFPGGPLSLRGFGPGGMGPVEENGCPLGAGAYWLAGLHLYSPLPLLTNYMGRYGDSVRLHGFLTTGSSASDWSRVSSTLTQDNARLSIGGGVVLRLAEVARIELNYCQPLHAKTGDQLTPGFQFGIGVDCL